jgi:sugar phosphate isomerase/epimerase
MKLGMLTAAFPDLTLDEVAGWAADNGFQALEVACWPTGEGAARRYAGVGHIDVVHLTDDGAAEIREGLVRRGLEISALAYYPNPLDPDPETRRAVHDHLRHVIDAAQRLGVATVATFIGNDQHRPLGENLAEFRRVWPALVAHAEDRGVRIAIENCPMMFSGDEWPGGQNLACAPATWREMFAAIPSDHFGLNFDPSHLVWQFIDCERAVYEFGSRILHVHAKDLEVRPEGLYEHGVMSAGVGWIVPRVCGLGQVDWARFMAALYGVGYDGVVSVELEDRSFEGSVELVRRGFRVAREHLRPYLG